MKLLSDVFEMIAHISWLADISGMIVSVAIGWLWYNDMIFGKTWMSLVGLSKEKTGSNEAKNLLLWHLPIAFLISANISAFCKHFAYHTAAKGGMIGYDLGLIICLFLAVHFLYEQRPLKLYAINAGYTLLSMTAMGIVIGILV